MQAARGQGAEPGGGSLVGCEAQPAQCPPRQSLSWQHRHVQPNLTDSPMLRVCARRWLTSSQAHLVPLADPVVFERAESRTTRTSL